MMIPSLSVVCQPAEAFGFEAARLLFERINGQIRKKQRSIVLPTELVLRDLVGVTLFPKSECASASDVKCRAG